MNIHRSWVRLALLFVVAAAIGFAIPTTLAYITAQSDTLVNTFVAPYFPPEATGVNIRVHKTVYSTGAESIGPEGFRFALESEKTGEAVTLVTDADGYASLTIPFTDADVGKTFAYRLYEINDGRKDFVYSDAVYAIEITLAVNAENQVIASASMNGVPVQQIAAEFVNTYNAGSVLPPTGDEFNIALYAALLLISGAGLAILQMMRGRRVFK